MTILEEAKQKLRTNLKELKSLGISQDKGAILIKYITVDKIAISQSHISKVLKGTNLKKIKSLIKQTDDLLKYIEIHPEVLEINIEDLDAVNTSKDEIRYEETVTWSGVVDRFVTEQIRKFNLENTETQALTIDAIGMKLNSLLNVLHSFDLKQNLPDCNLNCVIIDPAETGFGFRHIIEDGRPEYKAKIESGILAWKGFRDTLNKSQNSTNFNFRLLKPDPNFYMIKIKDKMLVSVYLRDIGNTNTCEILDESLHQKKFKDFYNLYNQYYSNDLLSSSMDWNKNLFE